MLVSSPLSTPATAPGFGRLANADDRKLLDPFIEKHFEDAPEARDNTLYYVTPSPVRRWWRPDLQLANLLESIADTAHLVLTLFQTRASHSVYFYESGLSPQAAAKEMSAIDDIDGSIQKRHVMVTPDAMIARLDIDMPKVLATAKQPDALPVPGHSKLLTPPKGDASDDADKRAVEPDASSKT